MVDYTGLENRRTATFRGFESLSLRYFRCCGSVFGLWILGALVQLVRISPCHGGGHGFESRTHRTFFGLSMYAKIAQLVEHDLAKVGVAGSSPVFRSIFYSS